jgi:hypothetical protein
VVIFCYYCSNQNQSLKQLFHIQRGNAGNVQQVLSLMFGENYGSFAITDKTGNELNELAYCTADGWNEGSLVDFFAQSPSIQNSFYNTLVAYDYPQTVLTPSSIYNNEDSQLLLKTMFGSLTGSTIISELIPGWQLYNMYAVPCEIYNWINKKFPAANSRQRHSLLIKKIHATGNAGSLLIDFRTDEFTLLAVKDSKLLLAQCFPYTTPEDIVYYLLKTCDQFSLSQKDVELKISGLIDKNSALYKELYLYFIDLDFREAGWNAGSNYPAHFFTSLNDLAQCAS